MKSLHFAIIGCGRIATQHLNAIRDMEGAELVAVCDLKTDRAKKYSEEYSVPWYNDFHEMLKNESSIDVVNIMTPSGMHAEHALEIFPYKKHIVIEKPMALRVEETEKIIDQYGTAGKRVFVVHQNRYNKAVKKLKSAVDEGHFGKMVLGTVRLRWCRPQRYYNLDDWRGTWAYDGGALTNQAVHHIDLLQWLMGEIEWVQATTTTRLVDVEVEDLALATIQFKNGAMGAIEATTATRPDDVEASISILGEGGIVVVEGASVNKVVTWDLESFQLSETEKNELHEKPPNVYGFGHSELLQKVCESIREGKDLAVSGEDGKTAVQFLNAIYASAEQEKRVYMKDMPRSSRLGIRNEA